MTHSRKRPGEKVLREINEILAVQASKAAQDDERDQDPKSGTKNEGASTSKRWLANEDHPNQGMLLLDATCAPAGVAYPTGCTSVFARLTGKKRCERWNSMKPICTPCKRQ
jgi:hypothetical protein